MAAAIVATAPAAPRAAAQTPGAGDTAPSAAAQASRAETLAAPETLHQGEAGVAWLLSSPAEAGGGAARIADQPLAAVLTVTFSDGRRGAGLPGFRLAARGAEGRGAGGRSVWGAGPDAREASGPVIAFAFAVPVDAAPGKAVLKVSGPDGTPIAVAEATVSATAFPREDIRLTKALTSLRVDPDPMKTEQAVRLQQLLARTDPDAAYLDGGFILPVTTPRVTSRFGTRRLYVYADGGKARSTHYGIDFGCPIGTPVVAAGPGRVAMAEGRIVTGNTVAIEHAPGVYTIYMHLDSMAVEAGELVTRGEPIGEVGMTGLATGPHLHWELRIGETACDPMALLGLDKIPSIHTIDARSRGGDSVSARF